jgi:hypothetical protein
MSERTVWQVSAFIEATEEERDAALAAIERALCPDPDHEGYCPVPWTTMAVRLSDLDEDERVGWQESFNDDRQAAGDTGTDGV